MNNLKKFATEAEYGSATLNYPAVSWVTATDNVHFDKSGSTPTVNDKVMVLATTENQGDDLILWNAGILPVEPNFTSITVNDTEVPNPNSTYKLDDVEVGTHLVKYGFDSTTVGDWFSGDIGGKASGIYPIEVLIPSKITNIDDYPSNINKMVVEATTPPQIEGLGSILPDALIYVPDAAVNTYEEDGSWGEMIGNIYPISEYSGNLPV